MRFIKLLLLLATAIILGLQLTPALAQDEEEAAPPTAKDTPYLSGMPNYEILDVADKQFDSYSFYNGKDCTVMEGKKMFRSYALKEGAESASETQILRNYVNAIKEMGGTVIFDGVCPGTQCNENCGYPMLVGKVLKGDNELWVEIMAFGDGHDYYITLIAKESMKQDVTASSMLDALNRDGHVALYINFDFNKAAIRVESKPIIDQIVRMMQANQSLELGVEGHTDNVGKPASNMALSQDRAKAVVAAIIVQGIDAKRLSAMGYGEDKPIADNGTEEGRAKNRRVELVKKVTATK
jgi:outer membrane protein OmpA-like peptidoglycan-associated protein